MEFNRNTQLYIAKNMMTSVSTKNQPLDREKWREFIDNNQNEFIWYEKTKSGIEALENLAQVPEDFKKGLLQV